MLNRPYQQQLAEDLLALQIVSCFALFATANGAQAFLVPVLSCAVPCRAVPTTPILCCSVLSCVLLWRVTGHLRGSVLHINCGAAT